MKFRDIINSDQPVLVDFYADWCGPCKVMAPILQQLKSKKGDNIKIVKIDVDRNPAVSQNYQITGIPTLILFKQGKPVWRKSGVVPIHELELLIEKNLR